MSDKTSVNIFNFQNFTTGSSIHALGAPIDHRGRTFKPFSRQHTLAYSLDDLIEHFHLPLPNHIKLDVDGTELNILKGVKKTLDSPSIKSILVEYNHKRGGEEVLQFLRDNGFKPHPNHPSYKRGNYIFLNESTYAI